MKSMTGFGRSYIAEDGREITLELKSVNSRYLDVSVKMPSRLSALEEPLRQRISEACGRGKIDVYIKYRNIRADRAEIQLDIELANEYMKAIEKLSMATGLDYGLTLREVSGYSGVLTLAERDEDMEVVSDLLFRAVDDALLALCEMRKAEGKRIKSDLLAKIAIVQNQLEMVEKKAPEADAANRERLLKKLQDFIEADESMKQRVLIEAALIAERRSIDEEIVRLHSHISQFYIDIESPDTIGRKLDFIVQEMNREVNTIGSKASENDIAAAVIIMKSEIEKLREQVQNIE